MTSSSASYIPPSAATPPAASMPPPDIGTVPPNLEEQPPVDASASVIDVAGAVVAEWVAGLRGRLELVSLELRRAGMALMQILMLAILAGLLVWAAWLAAMVGVYMAAVAAGLHWGWSLLIVVVLNLGLAGALWWWAQRLAVYLTFPATMRALRRNRDAQS